MKEGYYLLEEKRSRFIARAKPVQTEQEAVDFIQSLKSQHWDASHNCYAYSIENDSLYQRYSDDGEPQGTAGLPILEVIRKKELQNLVVVVTRYFGGILLGAGGLVRAYAKACLGSIENAGLVLVKPCHELKIPVEYHLSGKIQNMLLNEGFILVETDYTEKVTFTVCTPEEKMEFLEKQIREITGGVFEAEAMGRRSVRLDQSGNVLQDDLKEK